MRKKIMMIVLMVIMFLLIIIVIERKTGFLAIGYENLKVENNYVSVKYTFGPLTIYETDYEENVEENVEALNDMCVRKRDWLDVLLDKDTYDSKTYLGNIPYEVRFIKEDGSEDMLLVGVSGEGEISFDGETYILDGRVPTYIMDRCKGKIDKEFEKIVVEFKNESVTLTDREDIEALEYLFDERYYENKLDKYVKGWIYRVTATEKGGDEVDVYVISTNLIKAPDGNVYEHSEGINVRGIDKITGIERK